MAYDISALTPKEQVTAIYIAYYDRAPDPGGLNFWTSQLEEFLDGDADGNPGMSLAEIATAFANSQESQDLYDFFDPDVGGSSGAFLTNVYINLFGRLPDSAGLQFWMDKIDSGALPVGEALLAIMGGAQGTDAAKLENKIEVAIDWHDDAVAYGHLQLTPEDAVAARTILDNVDETPASVADAKDITDAHFNEAPTAANEFDSTNEDVVLNGDVSDETADVDGDALTHSVAPGDGPANGTVTMNADGTYTYTPDANFNGTDTFTYTVSDGKGGTDTATVTVNVNAVNDAPVAQNGGTSTNEDSAVNGAVAASDVDGDTLSFAVSAQPANGTVAMNPDGTYTYTPDQDFNGTDTFTYTVSDGNGGTDTATVTVNVNPVDDAPVAQDESASVLEDASILNGQLDASDIDNDDNAITFALNAAAPAGLALLADGSYTFDASVAAYQSLAEGETQVVTAGYTATSNGKTDTGTITITVTGTNDAPVAQAVTVAGVEDTTSTGLAQATDVDNGEVLTYSVEAGNGPGNGGVTMNPDGTFDYVPNENFNGTDTFTYTVTDSEGATDTATVTINVAATSDELTAGVDNFQGDDADDIITGNEATLNAGDSVEGGDGTDTLIVNVDTGLSNDLTFAGFVANVEAFQTTIDGGGSATFDMSGSEITGNTFINSNSTADVIYNRVNMNPDGADADGRPQLDYEGRNVTDSAAVTFTTRPADVTGSQDEANILLTNLDDNAHHGALSFFGTPGSMDPSGLEFIDITTEGSPLDVNLDALVTPGAHTLNIDTDGVALTIGDEDVPLDIATDAIGGAFDGGDVGISGFENALSPSITTVDASGSTGSVRFNIGEAAGTTNVTGGSGDDIIDAGGTSSVMDVIRGGDGNDSIDGGLGNDSLMGEGGNDVLIGGGGNDTVGGNDTLDGGDGDDMLFGENGSDSLLGGAGNDFIDTGSFSQGLSSDLEFVDGGTGNDTVETRGEHLQGDDPFTAPFEGDILRGGDDIDTLNIFGDSADVHGLNNVSEFEFINLNSIFNYTIGNNSQFEADHDARVGAGDGNNDNDGADDFTIIDGTNASNVNIDATTLDERIQMIGSNGSDVLRGGRGNDVITADGDLAGTGGSDLLEGGLGDDTFRMGEAQLDGTDTIDGDLGSDTIEIVNRSNGGSATLDGNIGGIETLKVLDDDGPSQGHSFDLKFVGFDNTDNVNIAHDGANADQGDAVLHVDGSELDFGEELNVDMSTNGFNEDIKITGGAGDDDFNFGMFLDSGDTIDGGDPTASDTLRVDADAGTTDADFANVSNVETLVVTDKGAGGQIVLGPNAYNGGNGIKTVDLSGVDDDMLIDASAFPGPLRIIDGQGNDTIIGPNSHPVTIAMTGGDDNITTGTADDVIEIDNGELTGADTITDNGGDDTVVFQNMDNANAGGIAATVNLDNVKGVENYTFDGSGDRSLNLTDTDDHTLTFQGGNVGTVTDINVDGSNVTDADDSLTVVIDGSDNGNPDVDVDYAFTIVGTAGDDRLEKANVGLANQIDFSGGEGSDTVAINDGDLGATTTIDGGNGIDWLSQTGGSWTDDDFINVSNVEGLTAESPLVATLGAEAAEAGLDRILGTTLNEDVTLDAAFTNNLMVDLSSGGDDTIDAGASSAAMRFFGNTSSNDITADDHLTGGTGTGDSILLDFNGTGAADLSNVNGVETVDITETGNGTYTLTLGATTNDNAGNQLTINEQAASIDPFFPTGFSPFDGETFILDGEDYNGSIVLNGQTSGSGAVGDITTGDGDFDDSIAAGAGNDTVNTNDGDDTVDGGSGNDVVNAGDGNDSVDGGTGNDALDGGDGDDTINGGADNDTITGGAGQDQLAGDSGADDFRIVNVNDSNGLDHDIIADFASGLDQIFIEESVLQDAGGAATSLNFIGNAPNFAQAQGAIGATGGDGVADWVFQKDNLVEDPTVWIDVNDDGVLNANDVQIQLTGVTTMQSVDVYLDDSVFPDAPTFTSVTDDTGASNADFITSDDGTDATDPVVRVSFSTATDGTGAREGDTLTLELPVGLNGGTDIAVTLTATDITNGFVDISVPVTGGDGSYSMGATITDEFGTVQTSATAAQVLVIDTTATIDLDTVAGGDTDAFGIDYVNAAAEAGVTATGTVTDVEDGQTVTVTFSDGVNPDVTATAIVGPHPGNPGQASGAWSLSAGEGNLADVSSLNDGNISVSAAVTDVAGNTATDTSITTDADEVVKDTQASINLTTPIAGDDIVNGAEEGTVDIAGTVSGVEDAQTVTITVTDASNNTVVDTVVIADGVGSGVFDTSADADGSNTLNLSGLDDGTLEVKVEVTDLAGNVATNTYNILKDATAPDTGDIDTIVYSSSGGTTGNGTIVFTGTFDPNDTVDATQISISDGGGGATSLGAGDIHSVTISGTQIVVNLTAAGKGTIYGGQVMGSTQDSVVNLAAGFLTDTNANASAAAGHLHIGLDIKTSDQGSSSITGNAYTAPDGSEYDDILTADSGLGDSLTGNGGADTFNIDVAVSADGSIADGGTTDAFITDFNSGEGDLIKFDASDINALSPALTGVFTTSSDGETVAFRTFEENGNAPNDNTDAVPATTLAGTIIWDKVNDLLRIDVSGDTSFNGFVVNDPNNDDVVIDLSGITGDVSASDIGFF